MSRPANDAEWELCRPIIYDLYRSQNKTLREVIEIMKNDHGFDKTKSQYEGYFRKWGEFRKNLKAKDWQLLAEDGRKRKALELEADPSFDGVRIPKAKLRREMKRHEVTTYRKLELQHALNQLRDRVFRSGELTPWSGFKLLIHNLDPRLLASSPPFGGRIMPGAMGNMVPTAPVWPIAKAFPEGIYELPEGSGSPRNRELSLFRSHYQHPARYYPPTRDTMLDIDPAAIKDLTHRNNPLELVKLAVKLLSDNAQVPNLVSSIIELAESPGNRSFLRRFLSQKLLSTQAFAEKLLLPAIWECKTELLLILLDVGVSVSRDCGSSNALINCLYAKEENSSSIIGIIDLLLTRGADIDANAWNHAIRFKSLDILKLLVRQTGLEHGRFCVTWPMLEAAARSVHVSSIKYLLEVDVASLDLMDKYQGRLLRAAAQNGSVEVMEFLLSQGLEIDYAERSLGWNGSKPTALSVAAAYDRPDMVIYLLRMGAKADGLPNSPPPLWQALRNSSEICADSLLNSNADPNISWQGSLPLQLAVSSSNIAFHIIRMLLEAGADVNATSTAKKKIYGLNFVGADTALKIALERGRVDVVQILHAHGARFGSWDPLMSAMVGGSITLIDGLLKVLPAAHISLEHAAALAISDNYLMLRDLYKRGVFNVSDLCSPEVACYTIFKEYDNGYDDDDEEEEEEEEEEEREKLFPLIQKVVNFPVKCGAAALTMAVASRRIEAIQMLLELGIKPHSPLPGRVRLHWYIEELVSLSKGTHAILEFCRRWDPSADAVLNLEDKSVLEKEIAIGNMLLNASSKQAEDTEEENERLASLTLLCMSAAEWLPLPSFQALEKGGLNTNSGRGYSLIQYALRKPNVEVALYLLEKGVKVDFPAQVTTRIYGMPYEDGKFRRQQGLGTALQSAVEHNLVELATLLIRKGVDVNARPSIMRGATALQYAAMEGNFELATMLLEAGADINAPPALCDGRTALEGAAEHGRLNMVSFLLDAGAKLGGLGYRRAVYRAWKQNHQAVLKVIQDHAQRQGVYEDITDIVEDINVDELDFWDLDAEDDYPELFEQVRNKLY